MERKGERVRGLWRSQEQIWSVERGEIQTARMGSNRVSSRIVVYTISTWARTVIENVWSLIGRTAPSKFLAKLPYLIWNHHEDIKHIDTVRAYTFGSNYFVEVDIVLPENMLLIQAHDIGEKLQEKIEQFSDIE
ncbi:hypothetical protein Droror1_Dr00025262 [Drosera rotundifolia]